MGDMPSRALRRLKRWKKGRSLWSASIPVSVGLVVAGLELEPAKVSLFLYIASVLVAGARVARFVVELQPQDMCAEDRLEPDEEPIIDPGTRRPVRP
jgi:hypothetical protein